MFGQCRCLDQVRANVKATFFDSETSRTQLILPDPRNVRRNTVQIARYRQSIIKYGNVQGARVHQPTTNTTSTSPPPPAPPVRPWMIFEGFCCLCQAFVSSRPKAIFQRRCLRVPSLSTL